MIPKLQGETRSAFADLMMSCFAAGDLRRFARLIEEEVWFRLPGEVVSHRELTDRTIDLFEQFGLLDDVFTRLRRERPERGDAIAAIWALVSADLALSSGDTWPLIAGRRLHQGRFKLEAHVGSGGFGDVWRAYDSVTAQTVALKFLRWTGPLLNKKLLAQFFRGANAMRAIRHPAIVEIVEICEPLRADGGLAFYAMAYVDGGTLHDAFEQKLIRPSEIVPFLLQVGAGLAAAHRSQLVHRDINPRNIMRDRLGAPKIVDFDFVRKADKDPSQTEAPVTRYAAPELSGDAQIVDARADIFSVAMIAVRAFHGREVGPDKYNHQGLRELIHQIPVAPRLRYELARATDWNPRRRHPTIERFCEAIDCEGSPGNRNYWRVRLLVQRNRNILTRAVVPIATIFTLVAMFVAWNALEPYLCPTTQKYFPDSDSVSTYTVPNHCSLVHVTAWGGGGGGAMEPGGGGGFAEAQLRVAPGDSLTVLVGGSGESWAVGGAPRNTGGAFGGQAGFAGASSGGLSAVKQANTWLLVAGGGGGAGTSGGGGGGGGPSGQDGGPESTLHGRGGTPESGGEGGSSLHGARDGDSGKGTTGGKGGGNPNANQGDASSGVGGGGGGGGFLAGGGGGGDARPFGVGISGGGGGGSGYIDATRALAGSSLLTANGAESPRTDHEHHTGKAGRGGDPRRPTSEATAGKPGLVVITTGPPE